jgi:hypothetical protein
MINCVFASLAVFLTGICLAGLFLPVDSSNRSNLLLRFLLGFIGGSGVWATSYSAVILLFESQTWMIWMKDFILIMASLGILSWKPYAYQWIRFPSFSFNQGMPKGFFLFFILSVLSFLSSVILISRLMPARDFSFMKAGVYLPPFHPSWLGRISIIHCFFPV